jgi:hypothetical protein
MVAMALDRRLSRVSKILVDTDDIGFPDAEARLKALTLEIAIGPQATTPAAHAAILTAVSVGSRTFAGGVKVTGFIDLSLNSCLPLAAKTIGEAAQLVGAKTFDGPPRQRIEFGADAEGAAVGAIFPWWKGWRAGIGARPRASSDAGKNPLAGIAAGAMAVGAAFDAERGLKVTPESEINLWPVGETEEPPDFAEVFLPGALWMIGLGNLGQAYVWALAALPYEDPQKLELVLQDRDRISEDNWGTSVLVHEEVFGQLKTKVAEAFATARGFSVRRVDRRLLQNDRLEDDDPRIALSGVDRVEARKWMARTGFDCIVDAGLGRTADQADRFRVTVFDEHGPIDRHFAKQEDNPNDEKILERDSYKALEADIGRCGASEIGGASTAIPYVSALAAAIAVARLIAIVSSCPCTENEVGKVSNLKSRRKAPSRSISARGARHAGNPRF